MSKVDMSNSLKCLEKINNTMFWNTGNITYNLDHQNHIDCTDLNDMIDCFGTIQEDLIVANLIIRRKVDLFTLKQCPAVTEYNANIGEGTNYYAEPLTPFEFKLLKEKFDS